MCGAKHMHQREDTYVPLLYSETFYFQRFMKMVLAFQNVMKFLKQQLAI